MIITKEGKIILAKFVDPEQKELSREEAESLIKDWMEKTGFFQIGMNMIFKIATSFYFEHYKDEKNNVTKRT